MPTLKDHIQVVKAEIDTTGKRLETETLTADQLIEVSNRMAQLGETLSWLMATEQIGIKAKSQIVPIGGGKAIIH